MLPLPFLNGFFAFITFFCLWCVYRAFNRSLKTILICSGWLLLQLVVAVSGWYLNFDTVPPRFLFAVAIPILTIVLMLVLPAGRKVLDNLHSGWLTYLHVVRVPVEISLLLLYMAGYVPKIMTFEGNNFDILAGLTAAPICYLGLVKKTINRKWLIAWNVICLLLLFNIVITAVLSTPYSFGFLGGDTPNVAVFYYPYIWLPAFIVPVVLFAHLSVIRSLLLQKLP